MDVRGLGYNCSMRIISTSVVVAIAFVAGACGSSTTTITGGDHQSPGVAGEAGSSTEPVAGDAGSQATGGSSSTGGVTVTGGSMSTGGVQSTGGVTEGPGGVQTQTGGTAGTGGTGGAQEPTGGTAGTGGALTVTGGSAGTGGSQSTGGVADGGSGGSAEPACPWSNAVLTFQGKGFFHQPYWSVTDGVLCAHCNDPYGETCGWGSIAPETAIREDGGNMVLSYGPPDFVELVGGACGESTELSWCRIYTKVRNSQGILVDTLDSSQLFLEWTLSWNGSAWVATVDRDATFLAFGCVNVDGTDFEPWSMNSFKESLLTTVADWIETIEWECPS